MYCTNLLHRSTDLLMTCVSVFAGNFPTCFGYSIMIEILHGVEGF